MSLSVNFDATYTLFCRPGDLVVLPLRPSLSSILPLPPVLRARTSASAVATYLHIQPRLLIHWLWVIANVSPCCWGPQRFARRRSDSGRCCACLLASSCETASSGLLVWQLCCLSADCTLGVAKVVHVERVRRIKAPVRRFFSLPKKSSAHSASGVWAIGV
jgi:hypothetical protein